MATKSAQLAGVGEILLVKRRGSRNIRLSITTQGKVRVNMPPWVPYASGLNFANQHRQWLIKRLQVVDTPIFANGSKIGKNHRLIIDSRPNLKKTTIKVGEIEVRVSTPMFEFDSKLQPYLVKAAELALKTEAKAVLPRRLAELARSHSFSYSELKIKKLHSRWGSCSKDQQITLSIYLMQLPWQLIDYVLIHELLHTRHMNHGQKFWAEFEQIMPGAKAYRRQVNKYRLQAEPAALA